MGCSIYEDEMMTDELLNDAQLSEALASNANISTPVRYGYGELDIAADWRSVNWALKTSDYGDALIDGVFIAGRNEWVQRTRTVAHA